MAYYLILNGTTEDQDDALGSIAWPGTTGNHLQISGGETILLNKGWQTSYVSENGLSTISFGSTLVGTTVTGTGSGTSSLSGGHTCYYDGPWAVVPPGVVDFTDNAFADIALVGDIDYNAESSITGSGEFPIRWRSGFNVIYNFNLAPGAVGPTNFNKLVLLTGQLIGANQAVAPPGGSSNDQGLYFVCPNPFDVMYWKVDDVTVDDAQNYGYTTGGIGSGTASITPVVTTGQVTGVTVNNAGTGYNLAPYAVITDPGGGTGATILGRPSSSGTVPSYNVINGGSGYTAATFGTVYSVGQGELALLSNEGVATNLYGGGDLSNVIGPVIALASAGTTKLTWPNNTSFDQIIAFCCVFPGIISGVTQAATGSLANGGGTAWYSIRFCYYKSLTLPYAKTGTQTQTIETPLSTPYDVLLGASNHSISFTVPTVPSGFDGVRVYVSQSQWPPSLPYRWQFDQPGTSVTLSSFNGSGVRPSSGFSAWPSGTKVRSSAGVNAGLIKWGHTSKQASPATGAPQPTNYTSGNTAGHHPGGLMPMIEAQHFNVKKGNTALTANSLVQVSADGKTLQGAPSSNTGGVSQLTNGAYSFTLDSVGHLHAIGSGPPTLKSTLNLPSATVSIAGTDNFFLVSIRTPSPFTTTGMYQVFINLAQNYPFGFKGLAYAVPANQPAMQLNAQACALLSNVTPTAITLEIGSSSLTLAASTTYQWNCLVMAYN